MEYYGHQSPPDSKPTKDQKGFCKFISKKRDRRSTKLLIQSSPISYQKSSGRNCPQSILCHADATVWHISRYSKHSCSSCCCYHPTPSEVCEHGGETKENQNPGNFSGDEPEESRQRLSGARSLQQASEEMKWKVSLVGLPQMLNKNSSFCQF